MTYSPQDREGRRTDRPRNPYPAPMSEEEWETYGIDGAPEEEEAGFPGEAFEAYSAEAYDPEDDIEALPEEVYDPEDDIEALPEEKQPASCIGCGNCTSICPQNIDIPKHLTDFTESLKKIPSWVDICRERAEAAAKLKNK